MLGPFPFPSLYKPGKKKEEEAASKLHPTSYVTSSSLAQPPSQPSSRGYERRGVSLPVAISLRSYLFASWHGDRAGAGRPANLLPRRLLASSPPILEMGCFLLEERKGTFLPIKSFLVGLAPVHKHKMGDLHLRRAPKEGILSPRYRTLSNDLTNFLQDESSIVFESNGSCCEAKSTGKCQGIFLWTWWYAGKTQTIFTECITWTRLRFKKK